MTPVRWRATLLHLGLIAALGVLVYSNTMGVPFVLDDEINITLNPAVREPGYLLHPERAAEFEKYTALVRRPVGYLTFALNHAIGGFRVWGYHAFNLAVHILCSMSLYAMVILSFRTPGLSASALAPRAREAALLSAALFASHPAGTQAVTYVVQRFTSLMALFYAASLAAYIAYRLEGGRARRRVLYAASLLCALLALKTKLTALTLPLAMALYEYLFLAGDKKKRLLGLAPYFLAALLALLPFISASGGLRGAWEAAAVQDTPRPAYLWTEARVMATYLRLVLLPINQNIDYNYPVMGSLLDGGAAPSLALVLGLLGLALMLLRKVRQGGDPALALVSYGILWFFLNLSIASALVVLEPLFEHRLYLPSMWLIVAATIPLLILHARMRGAWRGAMALCLVAFPLVLGADAYQRNGVWGSEVSLWRDVVLKSPSNPRGYVNLGLAYSREGEDVKASRLFQRALALDPRNTDAMVLLGTQYAMQGELMAARELYLKALELDPENVGAHINLGAVDEALDMEEEAIPHLLEALELRPDDPTAHYDLGVAYEDEGLMDEAASQYEEALRDNPDYAKAHVNLGRILYARGLREEAAGHFLSAVESDPENPQAHLNLGAYYREADMPGDAYEHILHAVELDPMLAAAHYEMGLLQSSLGNTDLARMAFRLALRADPDYKEAKERLREMGGGAAPRE